jgi:hypothetical protein
MELDTELLEPLPEPEPPTHLAGYFPHLPPTPKPTKGYVMPPRPVPWEEESRRPTVVDLTGRVFGFLQAKVRRQTPYGASYDCVCTRLVDGKPCGKWKRGVHASALLRGEVKSCGCGARERPTLRTRAS